MLAGLAMARAEPVQGLQETGGFGWLLLKTAILLVVVSLLAYLVIRFVFKRYLGSRGFALGGARRLEVLDRLVLGPKRSVQVIRAGSRILLIGVSEAGIGRLCDLDPDEWREMGEAHRRGDFKQALVQVLSREGPPVARPSEGPSAVGARERRFEEASEGQEGRP